MAVVVQMTEAAVTTGAPIVVVMGVSGCGKSTVGRALADRLGLAFADADELHPASNVQKMSAGVPLTDADRGPWLEAVGAELVAHRGRGIVMACSALRLAYRDALRAHASEAWFLHLAAESAVLAARMEARDDHFMPTALLASQLATLEPLLPGEAGLTVDAAQPLEAIVEQAAAALVA